jgi:CheY-like chemotaxis protein
MNSENRKILIVEDDLTHQAVLLRMIHKIDPSVEVDWSVSAEDAFVKLSERQSHADSAGPVVGWSRGYDVVLCDVGLAGKKSGFDLVDDCRKSQLSTSFVMASGNDGISTAMPFLPKPFRYSDVEKMLSPFIAIQQEVSVASTFALMGTWMKEKRDQQLEWLMIVASVYAMIWMLMQMTSSLRRLPFEPAQTQHSKF